MFQNRNSRNYIIPIILLCAITLASNILADIVSNELTEYLKPIGLVSLLVLLLSMAYIGLNFLQRNLEKKEQASPLEESSRVSTRGSKTLAAGVSRQDNLQKTSRSASEKAVVNPVQSQPISWSVPFGAHLADIPLVPDDSNLSQDPEHRLGQIQIISDSQKIAALPTLTPEPHHYLTQQLPDRPTMLYWSPNAAFLACTFYGRPPQVIGIYDHKVIEVPALKSGETVRALCWSPDGRTLALGMSTATYFWDIITRSECAPPLSTRVPVDSLDWSSSARNQLAIGTGNQIQVYTLPDRTPLQTLSMQNLNYSKMNLIRWSPDGSLLVAESKGLLLCWHIDDRSMTQHLLPSRRAISNLAWVPTSSLLTVAFYDKQIGMLVWDAEKRQPLQTWNNLPVMPLMLSVSPQQRIVMASTENDLLFGGLKDPSPTAKYPGKKLASWSPTEQKLATLDPQKPATLIILSE